MKTLIALIIFFTGYFSCLAQSEPARVKHEDLQIILRRAIYNDQVAMNLTRKQTAFVRFKVTKDHLLRIESVSTGNSDLDRALSQELSGKKISDTDLIADRSYKVKVTFQPK